MNNTNTSHPLAPRPRDQPCKANAPRQPRAPSSLRDHAISRASVISNAY